MEDYLNSPGAPITPIDEGGEPFIEISPCVAIPHTMQDCPSRRKALRSESPVRFYARPLGIAPDVGRRFLSEWADTLKQPIAPWIDVPRS